VHDSDCMIVAVDIPFDAAICKAIPYSAEQSERTLAGVVVDTDSSASDSAARDVKG
jgi:hypothetical protein